MKNIGKVFVTSVLLFGLTACGLGNNDKNVAFDPIDNTNGQRDLDIRNEGVNQDYSPQREINTNTVSYKRGKGDRNVNNHRNGNQDISASFTSTSSEKYPHTKAILIQDARYSFTQVNPNDLAALQKQIEQELRAKFGQLTPQLQQQAKQQAQQQVQKQPAQQQTQQQPKEPAQQQTQQQPKEPAQQQTQQQTKQPAQQQTQQQVQKQPAQQQTQQPAKQPAQQPAKEQTQAGAGISNIAQEVIRLTNQERAKGGLPALTADAQLSSVAQKKSQDMQANNYFSHTSPTYGSPFDMMRDFGVTYKTAGENIAQGQRTAQEVVQAWMNSEGHRKNIMSKDFTHIGVGYEQGGNHWTQMFIGK